MCLGFKTTKFTCYVCDKIYSYKGTLNRHIAQIHDKKKLFKCQICNQSCVSSAHLKRHIDSVHKDIRLHECQVCSGKFKRKSHLQKHLKTSNCSVKDKALETFPEEKAPDTSRLNPFVSKIYHSKRCILPLIIVTRN